MGISLDASFGIQIASFFLLWLVLKQLLFDPMLRVLEERERRTLGNERAAQRLRAEAEALRAECDERLAAVRHELLEQSEETRKAARTEERRIIAQARAAAARHLAAARAEIAAQAEAARAALRADAQAIAAQMAEKVLGRRAA